jgi:predicted GNAT superfamily acetyltransferase
MIRYKTVSYLKELHQILALQNANLPTFLSSEEKDTEGFLTLVHDFDLLSRMNRLCPHIIAKYNNTVIGYALCMDPRFSEEISILKPMFKQINQYYSKPNYMIMGQVCVDKKYRKQGVFRGLYTKMKDLILPKYDAIITEVDLKNRRSLDAHHAVGFKTLSRYSSHNTDWDLIQLK